MTIQVHQTPQQPYDLDAEQYVLAACILWREDYLATTKTILAPADFHEAAHGRLFNLLDFPAPDPTALLSNVREHGGNDAETLRELIINLLEAPTGVNVDHHARTVKRLSLERKIHHATNKLAHSLASNKPLNGEMDEIRFHQERLAEFEAGVKPKRRGVLAEDLINMTLPPTDWVIYPLASRGQLTQLQGEMKGGKSSFAFYLAICASIGVWIAGRFSINHPFKCSFMTWEDPIHLLQERLIQYVNGIQCGAPPGLEIFDFSHPRIDLNRIEDQESIKTYITSNAIELLVLDTLSQISGNINQNDQQQIQPIMNALKDIARDTNCAIIILHHVGKPSQGFEKSIVMKGRGSTAIGAAADHIIDFGKRTRQSDSLDTTECGLVTKYASDDSWQTEFHKTFNDDRSKIISVRWSMGDELPNENQAKLKKKIHDTLAEYCKSSPEGATCGTVARIAGGMHDNTARNYLEALIKEGVVKKQKGEKNAWLYAV